MEETFNPALFFIGLLLMGLGVYYLKSGTAYSRSGRADANENPTRFLIICSALIFVGFVAIGISFEGLRDRSDFYEFFPKIPPGILVILLGLIPLGFAFFAMKSGRHKGKYGNLIERETQPIKFYFIIFIQSSLAVSLISLGIFRLLHGK